jgi:argininosuccinate lyase
MSKLWGGRFKIPTDQLASYLNNSITFDWRLAPHDIRGSISWAKALFQTKILTQDEYTLITEGLNTILTEVKDQSFDIQPQDEDVHTAIERRLGEIIGSPAGKLHTGRSRNDQVMTDFNLWLKETILIIDDLIIDLQKSLINRAKTDRDICLPGYTHFQRAQPVLLAHWWLSHFWPLQRDRQLLAHTYQLADVLPLGSGALSGSAFPIDRTNLARDLGFTNVSPNSIDAVSNRDAAASFLFIGATNAIHLSRLAEALILYSTAEFGFIDLSDAYTTGSSLMPQKKNPDTLELIRAKSGTILGRLTGFLAVLKSLPSAYDKDLQEDKPAVFESVDTMMMLLPIMTGIINTLSINPTRMRQAIDPAMYATELADYLVMKGIPFREAHHVIGKIVASAITTQQTIDQLSLEQFQEFHSAFKEDVKTIFDPQSAVKKRNSIGGTSPSAVAQQIILAEKTLETILIGNSPP